MIKRLKQFIENQKISVRAFEQNISASDGMIRRAINNSTDIQSKWIGLIAEKYPQLNINWLLTGDGEMLKENEVKEEVKQPKQLEIDFSRMIGVLEKQANVFEVQANANNKHAETHLKNANTIEMIAGELLSEIKELKSEVQMMNKKGVELVRPKDNIDAAQTA